MLFTNQTRNLQEANADCTLTNMLQEMFDYKEGFFTFTIGTVEVTVLYVLQPAGFVNLKVIENVCFVWHITVNLKKFKKKIKKTIN